MDFSSDRWETVQENYRKWWDGDLKRPLIAITIPGRAPEIEDPGIGGNLSKFNKSLLSLGWAGTTG